MCGPASIVAELEQTVHMVSYVFNYAKTDVNFLSACRPLLYMEINVCAQCEIKLYTVTLISIESSSRSISN